MNALNKNTSFQADYENIMGLIQDYFDGLYEADTTKLKSVFHPDTVLKANGLRRSRDEWVDAVGSRPVPKESGMAYDFNILSIEIINDQAMVKADVPLLAGHYIDYLGLLKEDGRWLIVNKMYTTI